MRLLSRLALEQNNLAIKAENMTTRSIDRQKLLSLLFAIETNLRQFNFWQALPPPVEAFASELPFCHDTMGFPQWLQFIFLEKMQLLLSTDAELPRKCAIAPYAEEYFKSSKQCPDNLLATLAEIDRVLSQN